MLNQQKPTARTGTPKLLYVHSIFCTIQGEGEFAGTPAIFIRLAGCNLQCPQCDTEYTDSAEYYTPEAVVCQVTELAQNKLRLVVITGGEPYRQNISALLEELFRAGYPVQIETNGTLFQEPPLDKFILPVEFYVCVSPKTSRLPKGLTGYATSYKYVLSADAVCEADGLPTYALGLNVQREYIARPPQGTAPVKIFVQPADAHDVAKNKANLEAAVASCQKFGYRLSLQTHKIIDMP
jgi:7-carboxy-7-deazaguanine synthase